MRNYLSQFSGTFFLVLTIGIALPEPSWAQSNRVPAAGEEEAPSWRFSVTPNLWATGLKGQVGVGPRVSDVDLGFDDIFGDLNFGIMALFEARRRPWVLRADVFYVSLGDERATSADGSGTLQVDLEQLMFQPEAGYAILSRPWGGVDALVGVRYWHLSVDLSAPPEEFSGDEGWVDGTVGAAFRYQPAEGWRLFAKADAGAGGSDFTWQAWGGAGYDLGRCCTVVAAYRYLDVDHQDGLVYDVSFHGPSLGLMLHF
ncbi:MAG TPA: hypothetical protein VNO19_01035 [Gemmatimonadales bacterium]|nr:hypothetical protein [Gemmatimonadales bacterium]